MLKKPLILVAALMIFAVGVQAETWTVDATHSSMSFSVSHMVVSKTKGGFNDFEGTINFDGKNLAAGSVELSAKIASIDTDDEKRDGHLKGADFFDAEKYPTMSFKSTSVVVGEGSEFKLVGDLTMKGVTKEVTFDCELNGVVDDPWGNTRAGFSAGTTIDRQDFGISFSKTMDAGGLMVGNDVSISLELEVVQVKPDTTGH